MAKGAATKDIKPSWLNPIRAAQAACKENRGYGVLTLRLVVNGNDPVMWEEPSLKKIHPAKLAETAVSPTLLATMLMLGEPVDNKTGGT